MQLAADRPGDLGQPPLDRHVDVLVVGRERERAVGELALDGVEARQQRVAVVVADDPRRREHRARARATARRPGATGAGRTPARRSARWKAGSWGSEKRITTAARLVGAQAAAPSGRPASASPKPSRYSVTPHANQARVGAP